MERGRAEVVVVGAGLAGVATAARLQARGLSTIVLEAHGLPGGCSGYYRRAGFSFDVGATTLVDFGPEGVGGQFLDEIGLDPIPGESLPGYQAWLPDRTVVLHRDQAAWGLERLAALGASPAHRRFWGLLDQITGAYWEATRRGVSMPVRSPAGALRNARALGWTQLPLARYLRWTLGDALRACGLEHDRPVRGLLSMLVEDTVHSTIDEAPLPNAALGISMRGAGLMRAAGGMRGFWQRLAGHYRELGGVLRVGCRVERVEGRRGAFTVHTRRGTFAADQVVSAVPVSAAASLGPRALGRALQRYLVRDADAVGGAVLVCLGVPDDEVAGQPFTHHQLLESYDEPLGEGNNMFISVSAAGDAESAPPGHRAVMVSTHTALESWHALDRDAYEERRRALGEELLRCAGRVYPRLGERPVVCEVATPRTYERFTSRPRGAVAGVRQTLRNSNQRAVPHDIGPKGLWLVGDTTWPGLGTVACVLGSGLVADGVLASRVRRARVWRPLLREAVAR